MHRCRIATAHVTKCDTRERYSARLSIVKRNFRSITKENSTAALETDASVIGRRLTTAEARNFIRLWKIGKRWGHEQFYREHVERHYPTQAENALSREKLVANIKQRILRIRRGQTPLDATFAAEIAATLGISVKTMDAIIRGTETPDAAIDNLTADKSLIWAEGFLKGREAFQSSQAPDLVSSMQRLCDLKKAVCYTTDNHLTFLPPRNAILVEVASGNKSLSQIHQRTGLPPERIVSEAATLSDRLSVSKDIVTFRRLSIKTVVFDWSDTLVNEYDLDEAICRYIPTAANGETSPTDMLRFQELLHSLEVDHSKYWYDYEFLGRSFGKTPGSLKAEHLRNRHLIRPLCDIVALTSKLRLNQYKVALATNCHRNVLRWRLESLGLNTTLFDWIVTSADIDWVKDKTKFLHQVLSLSKCRNFELLMISDDLERDLLPAKLLGCRTVWVLGPRHKARSMFGTPALPLHTETRDLARAQIQVPISDFVTFRADAVLNILGIK